MPQREQDAQEANTGSRKATGNRDEVGSLPVGFRITGRIPSLVPGPERVLM